MATSEVVSEAVNPCLARAHWNNFVECSLEQDHEGRHTFEDGSEYLVRVLGPKLDRLLERLDAKAEPTETEAVPPQEIQAGAEEPSDQE